MQHTSLFHHCSSQVSIFFPKFLPNFCPFLPHVFSLPVGFPWAKHLPAAWSPPPPSWPAPAPGSPRPGRPLGRRPGTPPVEKMVAIETWTKIRMKIMKFSCCCCCCCCCCCWHFFGKTMDNGLEKSWQKLRGEGANVKQLWFLDSMILKPREINSNIFKHI